ncbi:MAG: hypothetical protein ACYCY1_12385 [Sulfuriferula sp.]
MSTFNMLLAGLACLPGLTVIWITIVSAGRAGGDRWLKLMVEASVLVTLPLLYLLPVCAGGLLFLAFGATGFFTGFWAGLLAMQIYLLRGGFALR